MNHKWIGACMTLMLCLPAGVLALYAPRPWPSLDWAGPSRNASNYIRIELPPVQLVEADLFTDGDTAVTLRESIVSAEQPAISEPGSQLVIATDPPTRAADIPQANGPGGVLEVSFDISQPHLLDRSPLEVRKGVRFNGADAGEATIRVGTGSALYIASEDLRTLLAAAQRVDLADRLATGAEEFVGFDEVRQQGLNLRYDAASDRILISG